jgi:hypothetical protein
LVLKARLQTWPGEAKIGDCTAEPGGVGGEKKGLTCGTHMSVTKKEKRCFSKMRKPEGKMSFGEYAKVSQAIWSKWGGGGL